MDHFVYRDRTLCCEDVPVPEIAVQYDPPSLQEWREQLGV